MLERIAKISLPHIQNVSRTRPGICNNIKYYKI